jgi:hypothetical protein
MDEAVNWIAFDHTLCPISPTIYSDMVMVIWEFLSLPLHQLVDICSVLMTTFVKSMPMSAAALWPHISDITNACTVLKFGERLL